VKTVSGNVVRHSLFYLSEQKWLVEDVPFYVKIRPKLTQPQASKTPISNQYSALSALAVTPSEKKFN